MPSDFVIPQWLTNQPSGLDAYQQGLQYGQRTAQQQQNQQLLQQEALRRDQAAAVSEEYRRQQIGIAQQAQARQEQEIQLKIQAAARRYQAQQRVQQMLGQGESIENALLKNSADLGIPYTGVAQLAKMAQPPFQPKLVDVGEGVRAVQVGPQSYHIMPPAGVNAGGDVQGYNVLDPITHQPVEGVFAVPSASGKSMTTHPRPKTAETWQKEQVLSAAKAKVKEITAKYPSENSVTLKIQNRDGTPRPAGLKEYQEDMVDLEQAKRIIKEILPNAPITLRGSTNSGYSYKVVK